jgi:glucosamine--fructose-6-phosphate aminotransferase (isomerizing)
MCGIFGILSSGNVALADLHVLANHAQQRGKDSSGLLCFGGKGYQAYKADYKINTLANEIDLSNSRVVVGHSRLVTNGLADNQPVVRDGVWVFHNGIVVNDDAIWADLGKNRLYQIDTEVIAALAAQHVESGADVGLLASKIMGVCQGIVACAILLPKSGKLLLFSNNGSLYLGNKNGDWAFSSEAYPLSLIGCEGVVQVREGTVLDIPLQETEVPVHEKSSHRLDLIPSLGASASEEGLLHYRHHDLRRCTRCLLTETMPFIHFDGNGVCNYCLSYKPRNKPKPIEELHALVEPYRRQKGDDCIVPFSGGRDSCYGLHLIVNELKMRPITYTYDWGMVTDLGRRNISRMCAELGVENIIVADDIAKKRSHIQKNLTAWLKSPDLGMISILTAGDKHFFKHVETIKRQTGISLNLWGVNPLEITHFKAGFLGVPPDFEEERVYSHGALGQLRYQYLRFKAMLKSPGYFNSSLWDTLSGEYYRSFTEKTDYHHIFDYWRWDEEQIDDTLAGYNWEKAPDTNTTWRIGDGTAAFYNYIYYTVVGFTEHDTFRSNQIREGDLTREEGLELVMDENRPRYPNIKWYLDALGMDFKEVISVVNAIPQRY